MKQNIVYKVSYRQWKILMACGNVKQMYGLTFEEQPFSEREMLLLLHDMVQNEMIYVEKERLKPCGIYKRMLENIRETEYFLSFSYMQEDIIKMGSLYLGEQLLWVENCNCRRETYEISFFSKEDWKEWMLEQKMFPYYHFDEIEKEWRKMKTAFALSENQCLVRRCKVEDGACKEELFFYEDQGKEYLVKKEMETHWYIAYHQNHLLKEIQRWIKV